MQGLVARGDSNADGVLDSDELRLLVIAASAEGIRLSFRPRAPRSPSSEGFPGVIKDLKLPAAEHSVAMALVSPTEPPRVVDGAGSREHFGAMRALLDDEDYENFVAAAARLPRRTTP